MNGRQLFHFVTFLRVIVSYLDVLRLVVRPVETDAPLVIDADAVLTLPISFQFLKLIAGRREQVAQILGIVQVDQFASSLPSRLVCP